MRGNGMEKSAKVRLNPAGWAWLTLIWMAGIGGLIAGYFQDAVELTPHHDHSYTGYVAAAVAALSVIIGFTQSKGAWLRRTTTVIMFGILGLGAPFLLAFQVGQLVDMRADFPDDRTQTFVTDLPIASASATHDRGGMSWTVQTLPPGGELRIGQADYDFMVAHRSPLEWKPDPNAVESDGWFCVHATVQTSGSAKRVLHGASHPLPEGTVRLCPEWSLNRLAGADLPDGAIVRLHAVVAHMDGRNVTLCDDGVDRCGLTLSMNVPDAGGHGFSQQAPAVYAAIDGKGPVRAYFDMAVQVSRVAGKVARLRLIKVMRAEAHTPEQWRATQR